MRKGRLQGKKLETKSNGKEPSRTSRMGAEEGMIWVISINADEVCKTWYVRSGALK